jgi:hypothetical protein
VSAQDKKQLESVTKQLMDADPAELLGDDTMVHPPQSAMLNEDGTVKPGTSVLHYAAVPHGAPRARKGRTVYFGMVCPASSANYQSAVQYHPMHLADILYGHGSPKWYDTAIKYEWYERTTHGGSYSVLSHYDDYDDDEPFKTAFAKRVKAHGKKKKRKARRLAADQ